MQPLACDLIIKPVKRSTRKLDLPYLPAHKHDDVMYEFLDCDDVMYEFLDCATFFQLYIYREILDYPEQPLGPVAGWIRHGPYPDPTYY